jgi:O-antigen/teichoic acid export membrane protein
VVVLPLLLSVFAMGIIETQYIIYFYLILVFEHLSQELYRLYTTLQKPIFANILLFLRTGLWVYAVIALWYLKIPNTQNLETIWYAWSIGSFISIIIGFFYIKKEYNFTTLTQKIDWLWIKRGLKVSIPFFVGTLAYKVIEFSDRYMIDYYMTKADVGIYTFFGGIANVVNIVVFTLVIMIYYPILIEQYQKQNMNAFRKTLKVFSLKTIGLSIATALFIAVLISPVLEFMGKIEFQDNISLLWLLLIANIVLNVSFIPHYVLYAKGDDIIIRNATLVGAGLNIALNLVLIRLYGLNGAAVATMISFLFICTIKQYKTTRISYEY